MSHADLARTIHTNYTRRDAADIFADAGRSGRRAMEAARASHTSGARGGLLAIYKEARDAYLARAAG